MGSAGSSESVALGAIAAGNTSVPSFVTVAVASELTFFEIGSVAIQMLPSATEGGALVVAFSKCNASSALAKGA